MSQARRPAVINPNRRRLLTAAGSSFLLAGCAGPAGFGPTSQRASGYVDVNGTRLYYEAAGSGQPVVLLHGFTLDTRMWDDQFDVFAREYRVIRYDARGFGRSAPPRGNVAYSHVDDLLALLDKLDARNPHLVGLSMGARFALDFAVTHPDKHQSLTVIDAVVGGWGWSREWLASYAPIVEAGRRKDIAGAKAAWLGLPLFAPARERLTVGARLSQMVNDYSGWHFVNPDPARPVVPPTVTQLSRIRVPTLVVVGERDLPDFQRTAERIERDAKARRVVIPGAGHMSNMEAPQQVNQALLTFLTSLG